MIASLQPFGPLQKLKWIGGMALLPMLFNSACSADVESASEQSQSASFAVLTQLGPSLTDEKRLNYSLADQVVEISLPEQFARSIEVSRESGDTLFLYGPKSEHISALRLRNLDSEDYSISQAQLWKYQLRFGDNQLTLNQWKSHQSEWMALKPNGAPLSTEEMVGPMPKAPSTDSWEEAIAVHRDFLQDGEYEALLHQIPSFQADVDYFQVVTRVYYKIERPNQKTLFIAWDTLEAC